MLKQPANGMLRKNANVTEPVSKKEAIVPRKRGNEVLVLEINLGRMVSEC